MQLLSDPLGGWASIILQAGAFGLLAYVVIWMFPSVMKDQAEERIARDRHFAMIVASLQVEFGKRNERIENAIRDQTISLTTELKDQNKMIRETMAAACKAVPYGAKS